MTVTTRTESRTEPTPSSGPPPRSRPPVATRVLRAVLAFLVSRHTAVAVLLAMAALALAGTLIDQSPRVVRDDPAAYGAWLDSVRPTYGALTDRLYALGLFHVFASVWFKLAAGLMVASILASTARRLPGLLRRATRPQVAVDDRFVDRAPSRATLRCVVAPEQAAVLVSASLARRRFRVLTETNDGRTVLYADRFRFLPLATAVSHAAVVLVIVGIVISASVGFRDDEFAVTVGEPRPVGHGTDLTVRVDGFTDAYDDVGRATDYASDVVLLDGGRVVASRTVRVNHPLRAAGVTLYQSYFGNAAVLTVQAPDGAIVRADVPLQWANADESRMVGRWTAPVGGVVAVVQGPASGQLDPNLPPGAIRLDVLGAGDRPLTGGTLSPGDTVTAEGWRFTFDRERPFTGLTVARDPGARWVWVGSLLMIGGVLGSLAVRQRRLWVRVRADGIGSEITVVSPDRRDPLVSSWFDRAVTATRVATDAHDVTGGPDA